MELAEIRFWSNVHSSKCPYRFLEEIYTPINWLHPPTIRLNVHFHGLLVLQCVYFWCRKKRSVTLLIKTTYFFTIKATIIELVLLWCWPAWSRILAASIILETYPYKLTAWCWEICKGCYLVNLSVVFDRMDCTLLLLTTGSLMFNSWVMPNDCNSWNVQVFYINTFLLLGGPVYSQSNTPS